MNVFYDDWINLGDADDAFGSKADNHLKVMPSIFHSSVVVLMGNTNQTGRHEEKFFLAALCIDVSLFLTKHMYKQNILDWLLIIVEFWNVS